MKQLDMRSYEDLFYDPGVPGGIIPCLTEPDDLRLPSRKPRSHKYSYGRALIIAGCRGYSGAPVLAANACERSGAGLTQLLVPESVYPVAASRCDGAVVIPCPSSEDGAFREDACSLLVPYLEKASSCVIGPGLGSNPAASLLAAAVLENARCPVVLDADALTVCGKDPGLLSSCRAPLILTPHEGEFRRLGGDLSRGRLAGALAFMSSRPDVVLVLKGFGTLICSGSRVFVNPTGSPALAKGGSGDVLCGVLCALLAQGFDPLFAAKCAVYLHGAAGDLACAELGEYSLAPSDLIRFLPKAFRTLLPCPEP